MALAESPKQTVPRSRLTLGVRRDVLVDRAAFSLTTSMVTLPDEATMERVALELETATPLFEANGWLDDPTSYHRTPPAPEGIRRKSKRSGALAYTQLTWDDGYTPHDGEPGAARFASYHANRIARAATVRHRGKDRPWIICVHGWGMGNPRMDFRSLRVKHLHQDLGMNVATVTLPLHARRKPADAGRMAPMPGVDIMDNLHGFSQAAWDIRQLVTYLRQYTDAPIGIMGQSLGGYTTALVSSLDDRFAAALPIIPAVDFTTLMAEGAELADNAQVDAAQQTIQAAGRIMAPVSPLHLSPQVDRDRRFIVAGTLDQFTRASTQAAALWAHWDMPEIKWFHGSHIGMFWSRGVQPAIDDALRRFGLAKPRRR